MIYTFFGIIILLLIGGVAMSNGKDEIFLQNEEILQHLEFLNKNLNTVATNLTLIFQKLESIESKMTEKE